MGLNPPRCKKQIPGSGICFFGAGDRTRTGTLSPAVDFESTTSTIPSHRQVRKILYTNFIKIARGKIKMAAFFGDSVKAADYPNIILPEKLQKT